MTERFSAALLYVIAIGVGLSVVLFFLLENGRANAFTTYIVALALLVALFFPSVRVEILALPRSVVLALVALLEYMALSAIWSEKGSIASLIQHQGYAALILFFVLGFGISARRYEQFLPGLAYLTVCAAGVSAAYSLYLHFTLPQYQPLPEPRLYGLGRLSNPVISAASYGFSGLLAIWLLSIKPAYSYRFILLLFIFLLGLSIFLSGTRTVWLALAVGAGTAMALGSDRNRILCFFLVFGSVGLIGLLSIGWEGLVTRGLSFRPEIWSEFVSRTLTVNPFLGVGSGTKAHWVTPVLTFQHPHSVFVSVFYFGGLVGLGLLLLLLVITILWLASAEDSRERNLAIMLLSYGVIFGLFDGDNILNKIDYLWWLVWLPIGLCLGLRYQSRS